MSFVFAGCSRDEATSSSPASVSSSPSSGLQDPALRAKLGELHKERNAVSKARATVVEQMKAKVDAVRAKLKTDDEKLIKAELEKDPEWQSLYKRCVDANTAADEQRKKAQDVVREALKAEAARSGRETASALKRPGSVSTSGQETASTLKALVPEKKISK